MVASYGEGIKVVEVRAREKLRDRVIEARVILRNLFVAVYNLYIEITSMILEQVQIINLYIFYLSDTVRNCIKRFVFRFRNLDLSDDSSLH